MKETELHRYDCLEFTVTCTMRKRWVPYFLGMLHKMQVLGGIGSSRRVVFFSDGDGDYRPKFEWDDELPDPDIGEVKKEAGRIDEIHFYDAG